MFLGLFHSFWIDLYHNQQQHHTVHSGGVSRVPCHSTAAQLPLPFRSPSPPLPLTFRSPSALCGHFLWTFFVYTICGYIYPPPPTQKIRFLSIYVHFGISATIHSGQKIQSLPYAYFFLLFLFLFDLGFLWFSWFFYFFFFFLLFSL